MQPALASQAPSPTPANPSLDDIARKLLVKAAELMAFLHGFRLLNYSLIRAILVLAASLVNQPESVRFEYDIYDLAYRLFNLAAPLDAVQSNCAMIQFFIFRHDLFNIFQNICSAKKMYMPSLMRESQSAAEELDAQLSAEQDIFVSNLASFVVLLSQRPWFSASSSYFDFSSIPMQKFYIKALAWFLLANNPCVSRGCQDQAAANFRGYVLKIVPPAEKAGFEYQINCLMSHKPNKESANISSSQATSLASKGGLMAPSAAASLLASLSARSCARST